MIAKMAKYDFVLYAAQSGDFIERLRELGLVDITTTGWEPSENDRQLIQAIEGHAKAADFLRAFRRARDTIQKPRLSPPARRLTSTMRLLPSRLRPCARRSRACRRPPTNCVPGATSRWSVCTGWLRRGL